MPHCLGQGALNQARHCSGLLSSQEPLNSSGGVRVGLGGQFHAILCPHRAAAKSYVKPPSLANLDKVNSNSLDLPSSSDLHQPHASKLQDLHPAAGHLAPCFTPSPAPILNINSASFSQGLEFMSGFAVPKEGRMYPKLSGLHRSMESLQMPMSLPSAFSGGSTTTPAPAMAPPTSAEEESSELSWSGSPRIAHLDRYGQRMGRHRHLLKGLGNCGDAGAMIPELERSGPCCQSLLPSLLGGTVHQPCISLRVDCPPTPPRASSQVILHPQENGTGKVQLCPWGLT